MNAPVKSLRHLALAGACLLAMGGAGPALADTPTEATPVMLVARPGLEPPFGKTVLVAMPYGQSEHVGFIVNLPMHRSLATLLPEYRPAKDVTEPVRFGGPLLVDTIFAVVRGKRGEDTVPLAENLAVATRGEAVSRIIEQSPNDARFFVGFVSWGPGELDQEISDGYWFVMRPDGEQMFRPDGDGMWRDLVRRTGASPGDSD
jgi:putative transcriptional regulator